MRVEELAVLLGGHVNGDATRDIRGLAALETAGTEDLAFLEGTRDLERAAQSRAGCILVARGISIPVHTTLAVSQPKAAFIRAAEAIRSPETFATGIHPQDVISRDAKLAEGVKVGAHVIVESGATVDTGTRLASGVFLGQGVQVGAGCVFYPHVTIYAGAKIGNHVILHAGVVVGSDGFGYVFREGRHLKFPQLGQVVIGDEVEIGSNTTVDRGSLGTTVIGQGTKIDNLVQIAHNVRIGRHCVIAAQTGIYGSAVIGDYVVIAGQVGVGDHVRIEDNAVIGGQAGILPGKIVRRGNTVWGTPARPLSEFKRTYAHLANLPSLTRRVKELSREHDEHASQKIEVRSQKSRKKAKIKRADQQKSRAGPATNA
jgi:UDP-3-O-[3-hydroxymyristoyl] glucosamine N-acyltransferase